MAVEGSVEMERSRESNAGMVMILSFITAFQSRSGFLVLSVGPERVGVCVWR